MFIGTATAPPDLLRFTVPLLTNSVPPPAPILLALPANSSVALPAFTVLRPLPKLTWTGNVGGNGLLIAGVFAAEPKFVMPLNVSLSVLSPWMLAEPWAWRASLLVPTPITLAVGMNDD